MSGHDRDVVKTGVRNGSVAGEASGHVWEKYSWEVWLESKGVPLGWWKDTRLEPVVVMLKIVVTFLVAFGIPYAFFMWIDWYYGVSAAQVYRDAKKGS
jgi:hypothetical protein